MFHKSIKAYDTDENHRENYIYFKSNSLRYIPLW